MKAKLLVLLIILILVALLCYVVTNFDTIFFSEPESNSADIVIVEDREPETTTDKNPDTGSNNTETNQKIAEYFLGIRENDSTDDFETIDIFISVNKDIVNLSSSDMKEIDKIISQQLTKDSQILGSSITSYEQTNTNETTILSIDAYFTRGMVNGKQFMIIYYNKITDYEESIKDLSEEELIKHKEFCEKIKGWHGIIATVFIEQDKDNSLIDEIWNFYN